MERGGKDGKRGRRGRGRGRREKGVMERIKIGRNERNERIEGKRGIQNARLVIPG
jgi:hypothetical protein